MKRQAKKTHFMGSRQEPDNPGFFILLIEGISTLFYPFPAEQAKKIGQKRAMVDALGQIEIDLALLIPGLLGQRPVIMIQVDGSAVLRPQLPGQAGLFPLLTLALTYTT